MSANFHPPKNGCQQTSIPSKSNVSKLPAPYVGKVPALDVAKFSVPGNMYDNFKFEGRKFSDSKLKLLDRNWKLSDTV